MRLSILLILAALPLGAEFLWIEAAFEGVGCASCIASLPGRLERVRGVERVEVDAERSVVTMHLEKGNRVRVSPLVSRITQDGTKVLRTAAEAIGTITAGESALLFQPSGLTRTYRLELSDGALEGGPRPGAVYRVQGELLLATKPGERPLLRVETVREEAPSRE